MVMEQLTATSNSRMFVEALVLSQLRFFLKKKMLLAINVETLLVSDMFKKKRCSFSFAPSSC